MYVCTCIKPRVGFYCICPYGIILHSIIVVYCFISCHVSQLYFLYLHCIDRADFHNVFTRSCQPCVPAHGLKPEFSRVSSTWSCFKIYLKWDHMWWLVEYPYISSKWKWNDLFDDHLSIESWKFTKMNALLVFAYSVSWNGLKCFCSPGDNLIICSNHVHWRKACDDSPFLQQVADPVGLVFEHLIASAIFAPRASNWVDHWDHTVKHFWNATVCVRRNFRECKGHSTISDELCQSSQCWLFGFSPWFKDSLIFGT